MNPPSPTDEKAPTPYTVPSKDYTLKEGQTFTINIPGRHKHDTDTKDTFGTGNTGLDLLGGGNLLGSTTNAPSSNTSSGSGVPLLPPPPPSAPRKR